MSNTISQIKLLQMIVLCLILSGCKSTLEKLKRIGEEPEFANIDLQTHEEDEEEQERNKLIYESHHAHQKKTNSLWQPGSTTFFRDSRAWMVGDIIRVKVQIQDKASVDNSTQQKRTGSDSLGIPKLFGKEKGIAKFLGHAGDPTNLISTNTNKSNNGSGNISRSEIINTEIAAIVNKVLPNGNLVIHGHQEVKVNAELREIKVAGIIRPKDISTDNSVTTNQIAEARISYGGRGLVSDMQQPRYGSQIVDVISPF